MTLCQAMWGAPGESRLLMWWASGVQSATVWKGPREEAIPYSQPLAQGCYLASVMGVETGEGHVWGKGAAPPT